MKSIALTEASPRQPKVSAKSNKKKIRKHKKPEYSNSNSSQLARLLQDLREHKRISTFKGRNKGYAHVAGRICDLRKKGHEIITTWTYEPDANGVYHRIGLYTLIREAN